MDKKLLTQGLIKYILGLIIVGLLIFVPAGTIKYLNGWIFIVILFVPMLIFGIYLYLNNPNLLKRRLDAKEKYNDQKIVILLSLLMFLSGFIVAGLNYRFEWIILPKIFLIISSIIFLISYILYAEVLKENEYLYRTIKVENNQKVIDTGLYRVVRHPMYLVTLILFLSIPFILGSLITFYIFLIYPVLIVIRIIKEEKVLEKDLKGYKEYKKKTKYRLIPFIW